jgi:hypothetical protein
MARFRKQTQVQSLVVLVCRSRNKRETTNKKLLEEKETIRSNKQKRNKEKELHMNL